MSRSDFLKALSRSRELEIAFKGRKTGRTFKAVVWFVQEGAKIYLLPIYGSDTQWYKNILENPSLERDLVHLERVETTNRGISQTKFYSMTDVGRVMLAAIPKSMNERRKPTV